MLSCFRTITIFDMEQITGSTSLQHILIDHTRQSVEQRITELFQRKEYPPFQLHEFYKHALFTQHDKFRFFIDILEEWNRKVHKQEVPAFSEALYQKNIFIYDTLKNAAIHAPLHASHLLTQLYKWFNRTRNTTVKMAKSDPQPVPTDEEWQIRNTFKSNLPSEIAMYRRRIFWNLDEPKDKSISAKVINGCNRKVKTEVRAEEDRNEVEEKRIVKIENALIRAEIERKEFASIQNKWKIKKYRESQAGVKNYYSGDFSVGKTFFPKQPLQQQEKDTNMVALKRVNTSLGRRSSVKKVPEYNRFSETDKPQHQADLFQEFDLNREQWQPSKITPIDGMRLLANPFEKKLKKKKRRN